MRSKTTTRTVVPGAVEHGVGEGGPFNFDRSVIVNDAKFKETEIVRVQGRDFPVVGGRLRIAHEIHQGKLSIVTELVEYQIDQYAVVRADVSATGGRFTATGTATAARDPKLSESLLELAETRAVARALRFAGIGVEMVSLEEIGAGDVLDGEAPRQELRAMPGQGGAHSNHANGSGARGTPCTTAQRRALVALSRQLGQDLDDVVAKMFPGTDADRLSLSQASALIDKMKARASNGAGAGR